MKTLGSIPKSRLISSNNQSPFKKNESFQDLHKFLFNYRRGANSSKLLSIILPMYNEEHTIGAILKKLPKGDLIEIIVVNDNSKDGSLNEIEKVNKNKEIKVISHEKNLGYGAAIATGIKFAQGKVIVTMDSDGQHDPYDLLTMIKPIFENKVDFTIGSRYLGSYYSKLPITTRLGEAIIEKLLFLIYGQRIQNNQNGFRAFNRSLVPVINNIKHKGFAFCTESIIKAKLEGFRLKEFPIKVYDRRYGSSKIIVKKLAVNLFTCIFQYSLKRRKKLRIIEITPKDILDGEELINEKYLTKPIEYSTEFNAIISVLLNESVNFNINR